jgi:hypothetical protein
METLNEISQINIKAPKDLKLRFAHKCLSDGVKMGPKILELMEKYLGDSQCSMPDQ